MLSVNDMKEIIKTVDQSSVETFKYEYEGMKVLVEKKAGNRGHSGQASVEETLETTESKPSVVRKEEEKMVESVSGQSEADVHQVLSPMVGTFYSRSNPEAEPFVEVGTKVGKGQVVCVLEAMKLFNEIQAEVSGEIVEMLAEDGQLMEYGQPLFLIKKD